VLDNISKLLQVLVIIVGGGWVLLNYLEFQKSNNELTLATARITRDLNQRTLQRSTEGRLEVVIEGSVVRSVRLEDGTFLYRYHVWLKAKNISDSTVFIPAVVAEFFIGTMPKDELKPNEALYINLPTQWTLKAAPGKISWTKQGAYAQSQMDSPIDDQVKKDIEAFLPLAADFGGPIRSGAMTDVGLTFLIRSRPDAVVGAVITYWDWDRTESSSPEPHIYTDTVLLSEAEDAAALKKDTSDSKDRDRVAVPK
jgi:hypothetical protein